MDLATLLPHLSPRSVSGPVNRVATGVSHDSREVGPTDLFVAIQGAHVDGRQFAPRLDCAGVIADGPVDTRPGVPVIDVSNTRLALARAAAALHQFPARRLPVVGITGTNGKTTTAHLLEAALTHAGHRTLLLGTTGHRLAGQPIPARHTTPEAPVIQALLHQAERTECSHAVMEVSSIGLDLHRVDALPFRVAAFTSFSQDHLDFHGDMDRYFASKARLFTQLLAPDGVAVLHADDPAIARLKLPGKSTLRYGRSSLCDVRITEPVADLSGCRATLHLFGQTRELRTPLVGAHNLENSVCAFTIALALGLEAEPILAGLAAAPPVPGRLQPVPSPPAGPTVFVDYAHTPDALTRVLDALRPLTRGQVHTVFGCGGDRDREKRPLMGRAAELGSDTIWVTSDNPRTENPQSIIDDIVSGLSAPAQRSTNRRDAIDAAIAAAGPADVVLIAGKGHETTQTIGGVAHPFDDAIVASESLARHFGGSS
jgi:UDP-N-acetylmuramoyl-L-alanyl-D-glutamate--2,6-diaminopimelate ligase